MSDSPPNLPIVNLNGRVGTGWRPVGVGELVRSTDEVYAFYLQPTQWVISSFWTSDGYHSNGRSSYRRPASVRAWIEVARQMPAKWWFRVRRRFLR